MEINFNNFLRKICSVVQEYALIDSENLSSILIKIKFDSIIKFILQ